MPSIYSAMNTAKMGLLTQQIALEVTAQNVSNINNPDFTRQELQTQAASPVSFGGSPGMIGTGVRPVTVIRRQDRFMEQQRVTSNSDSNFWDQKQNTLSRLEVIFNESGDGGLNGRFDKFFLAFQNLAFNPKGITERSDVISQGKNVTTLLGKLNQDMKNIRSDVEGQIKNNVSEINRLSGEIVTLNKAIHEVEGQNVHANDYRDRREAAIRELGKYIDINAIEDNNGQVMVNLSTGRPLVIGQSSFEISTITRADDGTVSDLRWKNSDGTFVTITDEVKGGKMGAWLELRDTDIPDRIEKLDLLAATFIRDINNQHGSGFGLDGSTGQDFFSGININTVANRNNVGTGVMAATVTAPDKLNMHKYTINFSSSSAYTIRDETIGSNVSSGTLVAGAFTGTGSANAYLLTQGISATITGTPSAGDKFAINPAADASRNIAVSSAIILDSRKVAAGTTTDQGNGQNALAIAQLQDSDTMNKSTAASSGTATFASYYSAVVGGIGIDTKIANTTYNQQELINAEIDNRHEQISGVSLDEEMIKMIKFQHAYQASARLVTVVDELLNTLIQMR